MIEHAWIIYDERAEVIDEDECSVLECCSSRRDLKRALWHLRGVHGVVFEYDAINNELRNGRRIGSLREGQKALMKRCTPGGGAQDRAPQVGG